MAPFVLTGKYPYHPQYIQAGEGARVCVCVCLCVGHECPRFVPSSVVLLWIGSEHMSAVVDRLKLG